jgi:antitoxin component YwqK of YwqJK toxin-antitoxin module
MEEFGMKKTIIWILFTFVILVFTGILNYAVAQQNNLKETTVKIFRDSNFQILDNKDSLKASYYSIITYKGENVYGAVRDFYKSGMPLAVGYYNGNYIGKGYENGKFIRYFENGKIFQISNYVNGLLDGVYIEYYPSGLKKACTSYTMGKKFMG